MPSRRPPPSLLDELSSDDDSPVVPAKKEESAPAAPVAAEPAVEEVTERLATAKVCVCPAGTGGGGACVCFPKTEAEEEEQAPVGGLRMIVGKKSKKQLQKEKKEAEARKRYEDVMERLAVPAEDPRHELAVEAKRWHLKASTAIDFKELDLQIQGVVVNGTGVGRSGVLLNGEVYEEGEYVQDDLLVKKVEQEQVWFVFRGLTLVRTM